MEPIDTTTRAYNITLRRVLIEIPRLTQELGMPPTLRELADALQWGLFPTRHRLLVLQRSGLVAWEPSIARSHAATEHYA